MTSANQELAEYCLSLRHKSEEHAIIIPEICLSPTTQISVLRQELDSTMKVIHLLTIPEIEQRHQQMQLSMNINQWSLLQEHGTDREITVGNFVDLSDKLQDSTAVIYKFCCAFINFSFSYHHAGQDCLDRLSKDQAGDLMHYLRTHHAAFKALNKTFTLSEFVDYMPKVFDHISSVLDELITALENNQTATVTIR